MQTNQRLNNASELIEFLTPRTNQRAPSKSRLQDLSARLARGAAITRSRLPTRGAWSSGWEDAVFAAMAAAGVAAVLLALAGPG